GTTHVPSYFRMLRPAASVCILSADDTLHLTWTKSADAWVYASGGIFRGIRAAFATRNIQMDDERLRLFGLSISNSDTTITFPGEFGLFDRFDDDKIEVLAAMQKGLPPGVTTDVTVAAADGN